MSEEKLAKFLKIGKDWSKMRTSIGGVFVLKLPPYKRAPTRLAIELNPVTEVGKTKKRRGLVLRSNDELKDFKELFQYEKLFKLMNMINSVNPKNETIIRKKGEEVLEL